MNKKLKAEIEYVNIIFSVILFFILSLLAFKVSVVRIYTGIVDFQTQLIFIIGLALVSLIIFFLITIEKEYYFSDKTLTICLLSKKIKVNYTDIDYLKFVSPPKSNTYILLQLKKRVLGRKSFGISIGQNQVNDILEVFNFLRTINVQTGLNQYGEKYFYFSKSENQYKHRKDVKIDIKNLW